MDSPTHRKIELQSRADLHHIESFLRTHARRKLDLHLPPVPSTSSSTDPTSDADADPLRAKTAAYMDVFIDQVIRGMRMNVQINGIDVSDSSVSTADTGGGAGETETEEDYEDLDHKLREQLRSTIARRDALISKIAQHRRTTGRAAAESFKESFLREGEAWDGLIAEAESKAVGREGEKVGALDGVELKRREEVERSYERAVKGLRVLDTGLAETRARLERAGEVVKYLDGAKGERVEG